MPLQRRTLLKQVALGGAALAFSPVMPAETKRGRQPAAATTPTLPAPIRAHGTARINVRDLGAIGDGKAKDTLALQQALDRCAVLGGGEVIVSAGEYLVGALRLHSKTTLHVEEGATIQGSAETSDYPLTQVRWEGRWIKGYGALLSAQDAEDIAIVGKGRILASSMPGRIRNADGTPFVYKRPPATPAPLELGTNAVARQDILRNPALLEFTHCTRLLVEDVYTRGNDMWSTHPVYCTDVTFRNVTVHSGADGIDVDSCRNTLIEGCSFETRDDCISLKSGRGQEGNTIGVPCENVTIRNCTFDDAVWACIGIGSETSGGIRNVLVEHCRCIGARTFAIYIKSRPGRGAFLENFTFQDIDVSNAKAGFLRINLLNSGLQDPNPVPGPEGIPTARNFRFSNIRVHAVPVLVDAANISPEKPLDGLVLQGLTGTCAKGITLANVRSADLHDVRVTGFDGPLLSSTETTFTAHSERL